MNEPVVAVASYVVERNCIGGDCGIILSILTAATTLEEGEEAYKGATVNTDSINSLETSIPLQPAN